MLTRVVLGSVAMFLVSACNQADPPAGECLVDDEDPRLYPLQVGAWWRHQITNPTTGVPECPDKVVSVEAKQSIPWRPEVTAYRVVRRASDEIGVRWQEERGEDIVRHVDEWFDLGWRRRRITHYCPWQMRVSTREDGSFIDEVKRAEVTASTPEDWPSCESILVDRETCVPIADYDRSACTVTVTAQTSTWTSPTPSELDELTVGGSSELRTWSIASDGKAPATYTWARGLGKVQEVGAEHEVLMDCCLPSTGCTRPSPEELELERDCP